jgi:hypothetical protein
MAKVDPRDTTGRAGPVRTSSGTRAAVRLAPLTPGVASQAGANDIEPRPEAPAREEMPTRELDLEQLREMALRCASDVGAEESRPAAEASPLRPHLELVLVEEPDDSLPSRRAATAEIDDARMARPARSASLVAAAVVVVALAAGMVAALAVYGALP